MGEKINKLKQIKALAELIKTEQEVKLAQARATEEETKIRIKALRSKQDAEIAMAQDTGDAEALVAWLAWSRSTIEVEQARQARQRAIVETCLTEFRTAFGRITAIEKIMEKELTDERLRRQRS